MRVVPLLLVLCASSIAAANAKPWPLTPLPGDKLLTLAPSLHQADLALIEYDARGLLKQLTTVSLVAAPPSVVHAIVANPGGYGKFVPNMTRSDARREPSGSLFHEYKLDYSIISVDGRHRYVFLPPVPGQAEAPIDVYDPDDNGVRHYRWEFYAAPGGTLLVCYGYTQIPTDGLYGKLIHRAQTLEYGLALIPQLTLLLAIKQQSEKVAGPQSMPPGGAQPNLGFLLDRGTVALFRRAGGRLSEVNLVDRTRARADVLVRVASNTGEWSRFVPTIEKSKALGARSGLPGFQLDQSLPLMSWDTTWGVASNATSVDMFGLDGDLQRGRMRWDVRELHDGGDAQAEIVLRCLENFDRGSMVIKELYRLEPFFEYGIDVGLQLVILRGVKQQAEQLSPSRAAR